MRASLAQTGYWLRGLGRIDGRALPIQASSEVRDCLEETASGFGRTHRCAPLRGHDGNTAAMGTRERAPGHPCAGLVRDARAAQAASDASECHLLCHCA